MVIFTLRTKSIAMKSLKVEKSTVLLFSIGFFALLLRILYVIYISSSEKLVKYIPDDPFYYFQLAANFIQGNGTSLDGVNITNGYHPLWLLIISPFFLLKTANPDLPIAFTLVLSAILSIGAAYFIYLAVRKLTGDRWLPLFAFGAYLFTERSFIFDMYGEPSPLSNLLLAIGFYIVVSVVVSGKFTWRSATAFGIISGLAVLARTDNIAFVALFYLLILFWVKDRKLIRRILIAGSISFVVVSPWLLWNWLAFGTLIQTSATACPTLFRTNALAGTSGIVDIIRVSLARTIDISYTKILFAYFPLLHVLLIVIGTLTTGYLSGDRVKSRAATLVLLCTGVSFLLYFLHAGVGFYLRPWHVASFGVFTVFIVTFAIWFNCRGRIKGWVLIGAAVVYLSVFAFYVPYRITHPPYETFIEAYKGAQHINEHPEDKFAAYDSGILSYYTDGEVLSIDGNVNPAAFGAVEERRVYDYMKDEGVDYFIGYAEWADKLHKPFWPYPFDEMFEEVPNDLDDPDLEFGCDYSVYKLKK